VNVADIEQAIIRAHHEEWARVVASLTRRFGDLDIAEEAAAEAFATKPSAGAAPATSSARRCARCRAECDTADVRPLFGKGRA
jgi:predicted RNA polymerase sigma factor